MLFSQATFVVVFFVCLGFLFVLFVWVFVGFLGVGLFVSNSFTRRFIDKV